MVVVAVGLALLHQGQVGPASLGVLLALPFGFVCWRAFGQRVVVTASHVMIGATSLKVGREVVAMSVAAWELHYYGQLFVSHGHCVIFIDADGESISTALGSTNRATVQEWIGQIGRVTKLPLVDAGPCVVSQMDWP